MKLKIIEVGFNKFNGNISGVEFVNGLSVEHVSTQQANQIAASMRTEGVDEVTNEDGEVVEVGTVSAGMNEDYQANINKPAPNVNLRAAQVVVEEAEVAPVQEAQPEYTQESLEAIADKDGMSGLRVVGDKFGVKNNSIAGLIKEILDEQAK